MDRLKLSGTMRKDSELSGGHTISARDVLKKVSLPLSHKARRILQINQILLRGTFVFSQCYVWQRNDFRYSIWGQLAIRHLGAKKASS